MKRKIMIGLIALFMTTSLGFLSACNIDNNDESANSSTNQPASSFSAPSEPITITVRTKSAKITDSGRANQKMDRVFLSNYLDVKAANQAGYTKLLVTLTFEVQEIEDGYQYVYLYSDRNCNENSVRDKIGDDEVYDSEDPSLLYEHRFEYGGEKKVTDWGTHSFSATITMNRLKDDLYIRYGASGSYDDDWQNRNIVVTVDVAK